MNQLVRKQMAGVQANHDEVNLLRDGMKPRGRRAGIKFVIEGAGTRERGVTRTANAGHTRSGIFFAFFAFLCVLSGNAGVHCRGRTNFYR